MGLSGARWRDGRLLLVSPSGREVGPVEGLIFDLGGTLDADGASWAERFREALAGAELGDPEPGAVKAALEAGERAVLDHPRAAELGLAEMVRLHVEAQLACLGVQETGLAARLSERFAAETAAALAGRRGLLERLAARLPLAVVSNGCGNSQRLLAESGLAALFRAVVDSADVGFWKPDPRIFDPALERLRVARERVAVVGDRADRDVEAALAGGLRAAWVVGARRVAADDERLRGVDALLRSVAELDPGTGA